MMAVIERLEGLARARKLHEEGAELGEGPGSADSSI